MKFPSTAAELVAYINAKVPDDHKIDEGENGVLWFVAMFEARAITDFREKDIASMLQGGTPKIDESYVAGWLNTLVEDFSDENGDIDYEITDEKINEVGTDPFEPIDEHIGYMYGVNESEEDED